MPQVLKATITAGTLHIVPWKVDIPLPIRCVVGGGCSIAPTRQEKRALRCTSGHVAQLCEWRRCWCAGAVSLL